MIHSYDLEKKALSGLLQHQHKWAEISSFLKDNDFYHEDSKVNVSIFKLLRNALDNAETIDETILIQRISQLGSSFPDSIDIPEYIFSLAFYKISEDVFIASVKELKKFTARREIYESCKQVAAFVKKVDPNLKYSEIVEKADKLYNDGIKDFEINESGPVDLFGMMEEVIEDRGNNPIEEFGFMGPHPRINQMYGSLLLAGNISVVVARSGIGKMNPLYTKVLTPQGFIPMRDIHVGSTVVCPSGKTAKVTKTFDHKNKDIYRVHFKDGRYSDCGLDHLWKIFARDNKGNYNWTVADTATIQVHLNHSTKRVYIPLVHEIGSTHPAIENLPISPYALGAFIGDGCLTQGPTIESADPQIVERVRDDLGPECFYSCKKPRHSHSLSRSYRFMSNQRTLGRINPYSEQLKKLGLLGKTSIDKFIPEIYFRASFEDRVNLLQGLMDTDGTLSRALGRSGKTESYGSLEYSTISPKLAKDVQRLVWSVGGVCYITTKRSSYKNTKGEVIDCNLCYRVKIRFRDPKALFYVSRKKDKAKPFEDYQYSDLKLQITSVEKLENKEDCRCIEIDDSEHLYVIDDYIVTHNTTFCLDFITKVAAKYDKIPILHFDNGEMSEEELIFRQCSAMTGIPVWLLQTGKWRTSSYKNMSSADVVAKVRSAFKKIDGMTLYYENVAGLSPDEMASLLKRFYYSKVGRGNPMLFSFDYIKSDYGNMGKSDGWQQVAYMVHKFKQTIHRDLCFDGKPCVSMITSVQSNRLGITTNRAAENIVDDESVVSLSDGITHFCSHLFLLRKKVAEEIMSEGSRFGTHKLINLKCRHLGSDPMRAIDPVTMPDGSKKGNFINLDFDNFSITERGDLHDVVRSQTHDDISLNEEDGEEGIPMILRQ